MVAAVFREHLHDAADRTRAVQRRHVAVHDLDTLDLVQRQLAQLRGAEARGVDAHAVDQHERLRRLRTAQEHRRIRAGAAVAHDLRAGREREQRRQIGARMRGDVLRVEHGGLRNRVGQRLRRALRGDDDRFERRRVDRLHGGRTRCRRARGSGGIGLRRGLRNGGKRQSAERAERRADDWGQHRRNFREALRAPLPRRPRVTKPARASRLGRYPGWRRTGSPSRAIRAVARTRVRSMHADAPEPACVRTRGRLPLRGQRRLATSWRSPRPASRLTARMTREHRGGASLGAGCASVKERAGRTRDTHIRGKKQGCYDWKRYRCRNARYSALKCWVFRGRSRCSTNSKPYLRTLAV